MYSLKP